MHPDLVGVPSAHPPVLEDHDPVGEHDGFDRVMGDDQSGAGEFPEVGDQLAPDLTTTGDVERGQGLVEQQDLGPRRQRPGQRDALLLAARQRRRVVPRLVLKPEPPQPLHGDPIGGMTRRGGNGARTPRCPAR